MTDLMSFRYSSKHYSEAHYQALIYLLFFLIVAAASYLACLLVGKPFMASSFTFYFSIIAVAIVLMFFSEKTNTSLRAVFFWGALVIAALPMAFRGQTAIDDLNYRVMFEYAGSSSFFGYIKNYNSEVGYSILNFVCFRLLFGNYNLFQTLVTIIPFLIFGKGILNLGRGTNKWLMLLVLFSHYYFLVMGAGLIRLFIALSLVFYSLSFLLKRRFVVYTLLILLASTFHVSSLIMLVFLLLAMRKDFFTKHKIAFLGLAILIVLFVFVFTGNFLAELMGSRYHRYSIAGTFSIRIGDFDLMPVLFIAIICYKYICKERKGVYFLGIVLVSLSIVFSVFSSLFSFGRLIFYGNLGIILITYEISMSKNPYSKYFLLALVSYSFVYLVYAGFFASGHIDNLFKYRDFFGNVY